MTTKTVFNYRSEIEAAQIDYLASLRDSSFFNLYGIKVEIRTPKIENNLDEYINYVDDEWNKLKNIAGFYRCLVKPQNQIIH